MPDITIREVDHLHPSNWEMGNYAFDASPKQKTDEDSERGEQRADARILMAFDGDDPLAKVVTLPMNINVRGVVQPHGGLSGVVSMPAGRRRGSIRLLMQQAFRDMVEKDGYAVSTLYPFRESFYEKLGYTTWHHAIQARCKPEDLAGVLKLDLAGDVTQSHLADNFDDWEALFQRVQRSTHGMARPNPARLNVMRKKRDFWLARVIVDGETTGAMLYSIDGYHGKMHVWSFLVCDVNARYQLLNWIARHVDQVSEARIRLPYGSAPEFWWSDIRASIVANTDDQWTAPMGRVVSIANLQGIGAGDAEVCVAVEDTHAPWNTGVWTFRGDNGSLAIEQGGQPETTMGIQAVSSLVFTGQDPRLFRYRGWGEIAGDVAERLTRIFPPAEPFIHEEF